MTQGPVTRSAAAVMPEPGRRGHFALLALGAILLVALALRTDGLGFGLPAVYNPDEVAIMFRSLAFAKGDLNPHNFLYPTLYFYLLFCWVGVYFAAGWLIGAFPSAAAFQERFFIDPTGVFLAGRVLSVVLGVAGVWLTFRLARRAFGTPAGLAAAAFLATSPFHVRDSHYVKHDVPAAFVITAGILAVLWFSAARAGDRTGTRRLIWASAISGVACSVHYYAVFLAVPLSLAIGLRPGLRARILLRDVCVAAGIAAAAFLACSPFLLVEPGTALSDIVANRRIVIDRAVQTPVGLFPYVGAYARMLFEDAIGTIVVVLAGIGVVSCAASSWRLAGILLSFPVTFFAFVTNTVPATRYLTPILPIVAVFAGLGATSPLTRLSRGGGVASAVVTVVALLFPLADSVRVGQFFGQADTRTLALRYVEAHIPNGTSIAVQPYSVPVVQSRESLLESLTANLGDPGRAPTKIARRLGLDPYPQPAFRLIYLGDGGLDPEKIYVGYSQFDRDRRLQALRDLGVGYVLLKRPPSSDANVRRLADALRLEGERLAVFAPFDDPDSCAGNCPAPFLHNTDARIDSRLQRPGPVVEVWKIRGPD